MYHSLPTKGPRMISQASGGSSAPQAPDAFAPWGVELLKGGRWVLLREGLFRRIAQFATYDEALQAAVRTWQQHDCPARPLQLDAGERPSRRA